MTSSLTPHDAYVDDDEPRVLWSLPGLAPHSGGFGADVTFLLLGGAGTIAITLFLSALLRRTKGEPVDVVGRDEEPPPP